MLHYIIIILVIIGIIYLQIYFFVKNKQKQKELKTIFPTNCDSELTTTDRDGTPIIEIHISGPVFQNITTSINNYLIENKGAASDFHLIKDVVDRNCDNVEEEITTLTPIPLYLGLIGTMTGILIGVGFLVFSGSLDALFSTKQDNSASAGIEALLGGVALAMISSIMGIFLTATGSYFTKEAKNELNKNKNAFLSWIQVKLLPTLSGNATSAIYTLQQNLSNFNSTFASNIKDMGVAFSTMNHSHQEQLELMQLVDKMDVTKMAKANIQVLKELQKNTQEFDKFNQYIHSVTGYLEKVEKLSAVINEHLNRTKAIEDMGTFFKDEIKQIEERKGAISRTVGEVDVTLQNALHKIQENAEQQLNEFIKISVTQHQKFNKAIEEQQETLQQRLQETTRLIDELNNLTAVKTSMSNLEKAGSEQNKRMADLTSAIEKLAEMKVNATTGRMDAIPPLPQWLKTSGITALSIVSIAGLLYILPQLIYYVSLFISTF